MASSVSVSTRRARGQHPQAPIRTIRVAPVEPILVPLASAQAGGHPVSASAIAAQEYAHTDQADVNAHRQTVHTYPSLSADVQILAPGMTTAAPLISLNVRA